MIRLTYSFLCVFVVILFPFATPCHNLIVSAFVESTSTPLLKGINLNQSADIKLAFVGVAPEYINQTQLLSFLTPAIMQFSDPNATSWTLNYSLVFCPFYANVSDLLSNNAFYSQGSSFFNITLLDILMSQFPDLAIPERGYLLVFMWVPNAAGHSWFYVRDRPDLFLNRTDYFNGLPSQYWIFPPDFGGLRRALYFDISDTMETSPSDLLVTSTVAKLTNNCLGDIFHNLGGSLDLRMSAADTQRFQNYTVRVIWINGTGEQPPFEQMQGSFEDLMPWTTWTITIETRPADSALNAFVASRTTELSIPLNYSAVLSNGSSFTIEAKRNVEWNPYENSGENDPLNQYFFNHVKDYFSLTSFDDKSVIPIVLLQLDNGTFFGGGYQGGVSWFPYDVIIIAYQGCALTALGESGPLLLTDLVRHEIGHWVSLTHYPTDNTSDYPKIICPMSFMLTDKFSTFSKDARARMSFVSFYNATLELLAKNQTQATTLEDELNSSLQSFYDWNYPEALKTITSVYFSLDTTPPNITNIFQTPSADNVLAQDAVNVAATVTDDMTGVKGVILNYTSDNRTWNTIEMTNVEGNVWNATIPAFPYGTNVSYTIMAEDYFNNLISSQELGLRNQYQVIPEVSSFFILPLLMMSTLLALRICRKKCAILATSRN